MIVLYILLAVLVFGAMIFFHELGHFTFAKIFKVTINEFAIGMGKPLFSFNKKLSILYFILNFVISGIALKIAQKENIIASIITHAIKTQRIK